MYSEKLESPYYTHYVIKSGDTLSKISKEFNMNPKLIAELNGLDIDDFIYPEQTLIIPKKNVSYYVTKEGDTLKTASDVFGVSEASLIKNNTSVYLLAGQMLYYKNN